METQEALPPSQSGYQEIYGQKLLIFIFFFIIPLLAFSQVTDKDKDKDNPDEEKTVIICYEGQTIEVEKSDLQDYFHNGATLGSCEEPIIYDGILKPYLPQIGKIEEPLGNELTALYEIYEKTGSAATNDIFIVRSGSKVLIEIIAKEGKVSDLLAYLSQEYGLTELLQDGYNPNPQVIAVFFPIDNLPDFNNEPWTNLLQYVRPAYRPITNIGMVTSQGDFAQRSDILRLGYGLNGEGIKVGVMSDSYNSLGRNEALVDIVNGDLPGPGNRFGYETLIDVVQDYNTQEVDLSIISDEGRAMLQIIHDIAPGATLAFRTGYNFAKDMAIGIRSLQEAECQIIVDDLTYPNEPFLKDGVIAKTVDSVAAEGVLYFTSAGNFGDHSYMSEFYPNAANPSYHDFSLGGGDTAQQVTMEPGYYRIVLQWEGDWYSLGETANGGADTDLDIYLVDDQGNIIVSNNDKDVTRDPMESLYFTIEDGTAASNIVIHRASGDRNVKFKYIIFEGNFIDFEEYKTGTSTITGHANAEEAITIGAMLYSNTPAYDTLAPIASFSSRGGTPVWYDVLMQEVIREKPNLIGPNGVNTTVSFGSLNIDGDNYPNFFGTSAAAPHAAGVAALLLQAQNKFGDIIDVKDVLQTSAYQIGDSDHDFVNGYGLIQGHATMEGYAVARPIISYFQVPPLTIPGEENFEVTITGNFITPGTKIYFDGAERVTKFVNSTTLKAKISTFTGDPPLVAYTPPITSLGSDGGFSLDTLFFYKPHKSQIIVKSDDKTKKYGEQLPVFTASIWVDSIPLAESGLTVFDLGLENLQFTTSATSTSIAGKTYYIQPVDITAELDPLLLDLYDYHFEPGDLTIEKLPLTITPNDLTVTYGDKIEGITFHYSFDSTNMDLNEIGDFLASLEQEHQSSFTGEDSIAIVDKGRLLVNKGRLLVNNLGFTATEDLLLNKGRLLVNGNVTIDLDTSLLYDYYQNPDVTLTNKGRLLVNGKSLTDGTAITDKGRLLVNDGGLINSDDDTDEFANVVVIVDEADSAISTIYSINMISGIDVVTGDSTHFIVPGAFLSPAAANFDITYALGNLYVLPAPLYMSVDDKLIFMGDPMPEFTVTIDGFKLNESERTVFSRITYTPTTYSTPGIYDIVPDFEWIEPVNYIPNPDPVIPGVLTVRNLINGKIAVSAENDIENLELTLINSNGTDPITITTLVSEVQDPDFSPDGQEIVFSLIDNGLSNLWKINTDGTNLIQLTTDGLSRQANFSPDGAQIVYINDGDIAVMNRDGSNPQIHLETELKEEWPFFSPDGKEIYFTRIVGGGLNELFKINLGSGLSDLISWWPGDGFDNDIIGGNHGILQGGATYGPGKVNEAFVLDGIDDFVMVPDNPGLNLGKYDFTISLWVNFVDTDDEQVLMEKWIQDYEGLSMGWTLTKLPGNVLRLALQDGIDPEVILDVTPASIPLNTWHHVAVSREENTFSMYWNGSFIDSLSCSYNLNSTSSLKMGHRGNPDDTPGSDDDRGFYLHGSIDEVKIFDRALDTTEIESLFMPFETQITSDGIFYRKPSFFRDGSKILTTRADNSGLPSYEIMTMDPDGSNQSSLYTGTVRSATVSPDGSKIAFIRDTGLGVLFEMDTTGSNVQQLYSSGPLTSVWEPDWGTYPDSYITIPDPNFEQALIDLGIDSDGKLNQQIMRSDAEAVAFLDISDPLNNPNLPNVNEKISEVTGIEAFTNLNYLNCTDNLLTNLDITQNWALTELYCSLNQLTELDVSKCTDLIILHCQDNLLTELDVSKNTLLFDINCWSNQLTSLDVSQNTELIDFACDNNQLTEIDITQNISLINFSCTSNELTSLDVTQNTALTNLQCHSNQLSVLDVTNNGALVTISCAYNQLEQLDVSNNSNLESLSCDSNQLSGLDLSNNTLLKELYCQINDLTTLDITSNKELINFSCSENQLTSLDLSQNTKLEIIWCDMNQFTGLDFSATTTLREIFCQANQLTSLDVTLNAALEILQCGANQLTVLDVSQNPALVDLTCYENQLTTLDVSQNSALTNLSCDVNQINSLDVSQNLLLHYLYCSSNQMTSLDVRNGNNANFTTFVASDNNLNCISVDDELADHSGWVVDLGVSFSNDCSIPIPVLVSDPNFEQALIDLGIDRAGILDGQISVYDARVVTILDISDPVNNPNLPNVNDSIRYLTGIEEFTNVSRLYCQYNALTSLDLSENTSLLQLWCFNNRIIELEFSSNPFLEDLLCYENQLTSLDVSQNSALIHLNCYGNQLTSLDVTNNTALTGLSCSSNQLTSLDISLNTDLTGLDCAGNLLTTLDVSSNTSLTYLHCPFNQLSSLDVSANTDLVNLLCAGNQLTSLDVSNNTALTEIKCEDNQLTELDVTQNTALQFLTCNHNLLNSLDLTNNTVLLQVDCGANQLTELDVSQNILLEDITCYENQLTSLDVSNNSALSALSCDVNQITSLDVSQNPQLTYLYCSVNQLTNLDVRNGNNANFNTFVADQNNLTCISVDDETADHSGWITDYGVSLSNNCDIPVDVLIPDPNFEQALIDLGIDRSGILDHQISEYDVLVVDQLNISDPLNNPDLPNVHAKISDLAGIEAFTNLKYLDCSFNEISDLDITPLSKLIEIWCTDNLLTHLDVSQNPSLIDIRCHSNQITSLDVSHNPALTHLSCYENPIPILDVSTNINLEYLACPVMELTDLDVSQNTLLTYLNCDGNHIPDLDVSQNTLLEYLACADNLLTELDVSSNAALGHLDCHDNMLSSLDLTHNPYLINLICHSNQLNGLDLSRNTYLQQLDFSVNHITELDLTHNIALTDLSCHDNTLTSLDVSTNTALVALSCDFNQITSLDLSQNTSLTYVYCSVNQLVDLDVRNGNNTNFTTFVADANNLSCISVDDETADHSSWVVDPGVEFRNQCNDYVLIPDANFEQALISLGYDTDGMINKLISGSDAESVTTLALGGKNISDISGIEGFVNLTSLDIRQNQITDIDLSRNTLLTSLVCTNNLLNQLDVSQNTLLNTLLCDNNQLGGLDLSNNPALLTLTCNNNLIASLDLSSNTSLHTLWCASNQITSLNVTQCTNLIYLYCEDNQLTYLDVMNNPELVRFHCYRNNLTSLDVTQNTALAYLECWMNNITNLNLTGISGLINLNCKANMIPSLDVSQCNNLESLNCGVNQIISLDISNNTALTALHCNANQLTILDVSQNVLLRTLNCAENQISILDVSQDTLITDLYCWQNQLTGLDVSSIKNLINLICSYNQITDLDVTLNTTLEWFECNNNLLTTLDLRNGNNTNFSRLYAHNNPDLTCIDVDNKTADHSSWVVDPGISYSNDCALESTAIIGGPVIEDGNVKLYPNPVVDWLTIEFTDLSVALGDVIIHVYDDYANPYSMTIIESVTVYGFEVDFQPLLPGTYYVQLYDGIEVRVFRIVKE